MALITSLFTVGSAGASTARAWCRPTHRTNCAYVIGANSCCICIPASATCYVIEMWGQGGGGGGVCCCMGALYGGQAGSYGFVTCTTSGQVHTMCMCSCVCTCASCGTTGMPGQLSVVCDCSLSINWTVAGNACGGMACCNGIQTMGAGGCSTCGGSYSRNPAHANMSINCCCFGQWIAQIGVGHTCVSHWTTETCDTRDMFQLGANMPFLQRQGTNAYGCTCACCTRFNFYVQGACGWSAPDLVSVYGSDTCNGQLYNKPTCTYCGAGLYGSGGTAYAGGAGQCCNCDMGNYYWQGADGNFPGGGGSNAGHMYSPGSCCIGSCGGFGLILISWS